MLTYTASPTGQAFLDDRTFIKLIMGPVGGGKSTVCLFGLLDMAVNQQAHEGVRRTKFLLVRNTMQQLKSTVKPLIDYWFIEKTAGAMGQWRLTDMVFEMKFLLPDNTIVHSEFCFLPADTPDDVRRLLSLEASAAWLEEAREIDQAIFEGIQGRVMRFPNMEAGGITYPAVLMSTNPPPMGTWLQELMADPPSNFKAFLQPPAILEDGSLNPDAENLVNLNPDYYPNLMEGKTPDWIDVFLKNKFGAGGFGLPVFASTFKRAFHVSSERLRAIPSANHPIVIGCDNGLTAAAVVGQMDARGRVNILGEAYVPQGESMGFDTFLDRLLTPMLQAKFPQHPSSFVFVVDEACYQRSQATEITIAQVIASRGYNVRRALSNKPERRIAAVEGLLVRQIDGKAGLLISEEDCPWLVKALDFGYRNKKQANGVVTATPEKNHYSHVADALQYLSLHYNAGISPAALGKMGRREIRPGVAYQYV